MSFGGTSLLPTVTDVAVSSPTASAKFSGALGSVMDDVVSTPVVTSKVSGVVVSAVNEAGVAKITESGDAGEVVSVVGVATQADMETGVASLVDSVATGSGVAAEGSGVLSTAVTGSGVGATGVVFSPSTAPIPRSWANVVLRQSALSKFDVAVSVVDGKSTVAVPDEILEDSPPLWEDFLVGRFPSEAPHVAKIHVIVNKIWNLGDKSIRIDVYKVNDKTVKFWIRHPSARQRVLRRSMWNICDLPMVVSRWTPIAEDAQPVIKTMPMWVTVKNVPNSMFTWKGLSYLTSPVGIPKRLHPETEQVVNFDEAKVFVEVDMTKELPKKYYFQIKGMEVEVSFEYPWLPPRCGVCGKWGHSVDSCVTNIRSALGKTISPKKAQLVDPCVETVRCDISAQAVTQERTVSAVALEDQDCQTVVLEEGEIESSIKTQAGSKDGEWLTVTHSSGSKRDKVKQLVYGQVRIASPTRFDVLRDDSVVEGLGLLNPVMPIEDHSPLIANESVAGEVQSAVGISETGLTVEQTGHTPALRILPSRTAKDGNKVTGRKNSKPQQGGNSRCVGKKVSKNNS